MSWSLTFPLAYIITHVHSQKYIYNGDYQLTHSNWEATCLFYYDRHLASIHNPAENTEAYTTVLSTAWIGLTDFVEDTWVWSDSTPWDYGLTDYITPWQNDQPDNLNGDQDCTGLYYASNEWVDYDCADTYSGLCGYPNGFSVLNDKPSYVRIRGQGTLIGTIDILDEVYISFYITFQSWPSGWGNILHFGNDDSQHYPAIHIEGTSHYIRSSFGLISNSNPSHDSSSGYALGTEYLYTLHQTQRHLTITFAGATVYDSDTESHPIVMDRAVYLGSSWYNTFSATLRNVQVTTSNSPENTFWNYICDWSTRFTFNSGTWGYGSTGGDCSIRQSTETATTMVAWLGTNDVDSLSWTDYKIEMIINIRSTTGTREAGIILRANNANCGTTDCGQYYALQMSYDGFKFAKINNGLSLIGTSYSISQSPDVPYLIRIEASGSSFALYRNNVYLQTWTDSSYTTGSAGFYSYGTDVRFSKMRITFPDTQQWYTANPSQSPTTHPTKYPTSDPTAAPTKNPTIPPTKAPTKTPTKTPSKNPTNGPTTEPTNIPTVYPTAHPTVYPTNVPSNGPTKSTIIPTTSPTTDPTGTPTTEPSIEPTRNPTFDPTNAPSTAPTTPPSQSHASPITPTTPPTFKPTQPPTSNPTESALSYNDDSQQEQRNNLEITFQYFIVVIFGSVLIIALFGYLHSRFFTNDFFQITYIIVAGIQMFDTFSDCCFAINLSTYIDNERDISNVFKILLTLSALCIIIPIVVSIMQLFLYSQKHWVSDIRITGWLAKKTKYLYILSFLTGSSFTAVSLLNCELFGWSLFCMGLSERDVLTFSIKRVYSVIVAENLPQAVIQCWYIVYNYNEEGANTNYIAITSLIFSFMSIIVAFLSFVGQKRIINAQSYVEIKMDVIGKFDRRKCKGMIEGLKTYFYFDVFVVDKHLIEVLKPLPIIKGLQLTVRIYCDDKNDKSESQRYDTLINDARSNGELAQQIKIFWNTQNEPNIENIQVETIESKNIRHYTRDMTMMREAVKSMSSDDANDTVVVEMSPQTKVNVT